MGPTLFYLLNCPDSMESNALLLMKRIKIWSSGGGSTGTTRTRQTCSATWCLSTGTHPYSEINIPAVRNKKKLKKKSFLLASRKPLQKKSRIRIRIKMTRIRNTDWFVFNFATSVSWPSYETGIFPTFNKNIHSKRWVIFKLNYVLCRYHWASSWYWTFCVSN